MMLRIGKLNAYTIPESVSNALLLQLSTQVVSVLNRYLQSPVDSRSRSLLTHIVKSVAALRFPSATSQLTDWIAQFASSSSLEQSLDLTVCILFLLRESFLVFLFLLIAEHSMGSVLAALQQLATPDSFKNAPVDKLLLYLLIVCHEADAINQTEVITQKDDSAELSDEALAAQVETQRLFSQLNEAVSSLLSTDLLPTAFTTIVNRLPQTSFNSKSLVCIRQTSHCSLRTPISRLRCCCSRIGSRRSRFTRCSGWASRSPRRCSTCSSTTWTGCRRRE